MSIKISYTNDKGEKIAYTPKKRSCADGSHPVCTSSDSNLPECVCWCAECKDIMKEIAKNWKKGLL